MSPRRNAVAVVAPLVLMLAVPAVAQEWTFTFSEADLGHFEPVIAGLNRKPGPLGRALADAVMLSAKGPANATAPPRGEFGEGWFVALTIAKFGTDAAAAERWRGNGQMAANLIEFSRRQLAATEQSLPREGLAGYVKAADDRVDVWNPRYYFHDQGARGAPPQDVNRKYRLELGREAVVVYKNCIIDVRIGNNVRFAGGQGVPGEALLPIGPDPLILAAKRLIDGKRGEAVEEPPATEPAEPEPEPDGTVDTEMAWLQRMSDAASAAAHKAAVLRAKLSVQRLAMAEMRKRIDCFQKALRDGGKSLHQAVAEYGDELWGEAPGEADLRGELQEEIDLMGRELQDIAAEQDQQIADMLETYDRLAQEVELVGGRAENQEVRRAAAFLQRQTELQRDLDSMQLHLCAGQFEELQVIAERFILQGKHVSAARVMLTQERIESGDPRGALDEVRECLRLDPDNEVAQKQLAGLEVAYLRSIDQKALTEASGIAAMCWDRLDDHGEPGFWGAAKDILTTGVTTLGTSFIDPGADLADHAGAIQMDAASQHVGIVLITRLREKGLTLAEIRRLSNDEFIGAVGSPESNVTAEDALRMRAAIMYAFQNPDVVKLEKRSADALAVEGGDPYYDSEPFRETWLQWAGDIVNIKNVLLCAGPSAIAKAGGAWAWHGSALTAEQLGTAVTVKDAFASAVYMPELADAIARSAHGQRAIGALVGTYQQSGPVSRFVAQVLVQYGLVTAGAETGRAIGQLAGGQEGEYIGGVAGELVATIVTALGVGDLELATRLLGEAGLRQQHVALLENTISKATAELQRVPARGAVYGPRLERAASELERGALSQGSRELLEQSSRELDDEISALIARIGRGETSLAVAQQAQHAKAMKAAFDALREGRTLDARHARELVEEIEALVNGHVGTLDIQRQAVAGLGGAVGQSGPPASTGGTVRNPAMRGGAPGTGASGAGGLDDLARLNLRRGIELRRHSDRLLLAGEYQEAAERYEQLDLVVRMWGGEGSGAAKEVSAKLRLARAAAQAEQRLRRASASEPGQLAAPISDAERQALAGAAKLRPMVEKSLTNPHWVDVDGETVGVFKQAQAGRGGTDLKAERLYVEFAREVGGKAPACEMARMTLPDGTQAEGLLVRYVDGAPLRRLDAGTALAVKRDLARDRVLAAFLGDHDRHFGNYLVSPERGLVSIDHGLADYADDAVSGGTLDAAGFDNPVVGPELRKRVGENMAWRITRPREVYPDLKLFDQMLVYDDMADTARQLQAMDAAQLRALAGRVLDGPELERTVRVLQARQQHLSRVLEQCFPGVPPRGAAQLPSRRPSRWFAMPPLPATLPRAA